MSNLNLLFRFSFAFFCYKQITTQLHNIHHSLFNNDVKRRDLSSSIPQKNIKCIEILKKYKVLNQPEKTGKTTRFQISYKRIEDSDTLISFKSLFS